MTIHDFAAKAPVRMRAVCAVCLVMLEAASAGTGGHMRGTTAEGFYSSESGFGLAFDAVMGRGRPMTKRQVAVIQSQLQPPFVSLPKNSFGRLAPRAVRHIVHTYFSKVHGWIIDGLGPHGIHESAADVHQVSILQNKAPKLVEALVRSERGLSFGDVVTLTHALEQLVLNEALELLLKCYSLVDAPMGITTREGLLHDVLATYLLIFGMGQLNISSVPKQRQTRARMIKVGGSMAGLVDIENDALLNYRYTHRHVMNPFAPPQYSFEAVSHILEDMMLAYADWQKADCIHMKNVLIQLAHDGSGHIPLHTFFDVPDKGYHFTESVEYLRQIGALDESTPRYPRVRIVNYLLGPSNCIASSRYYSACCANECQALLQELESAVQAPTAPPALLLSLVANLSSSTVDVPRKLPVALAEKLSVVSSQSGGKVPLHGRLFAQWLHHAFPQQCPYPEVLGQAESEAQMRQRFLGAQPTVSEEERRQFSADLQANFTWESEMGSDLFAPQWSDHEVLPVLEPPRHARSGLRDAIGWVMKFTALGFALRAAVSTSMATMRAAGKRLDLQQLDSERPDRLEIPLRI